MTQTVPSLHRPGHLTSPPFEVRVVIGRNVVALRGGRASTSAFCEKLPALRRCVEGIGRRPRCLVPACHGLVDGRRVPAFRR